MSPAKLIACLLISSTIGGAVGAFIEYTRWAPAFAGYQAERIAREGRTDAEYFKTRK